MTIMGKIQARDQEMSIDLPIMIPKTRFGRFSKLYL